MTSLKVNTPFLEVEWKPQDGDKAVAWELHAELLTRSATQSLTGIHGDEKIALTIISYN